MAGIEIMQIPDSIDYASLKQHEDMHSALVQNQAHVENEKKTELSHSQVSDAEKTEMKADDHGGGSNSYSGDGGQNRKKKSEDNSDKVVIKGASSSFDIKV